MSANFYELLKYAATGIASPDMTYYDRMRASTLMGGVVQTLTGIPPLSFKADGTPLISWSMKGNGSQSGTPTPSAPIQPDFVGVRTAQLFDVNGKNTANGYVDNRQLNSDGSMSTWGSVEISEYIPIVGGASYSFNGIGSYNSPAYCFYDADKQYISGDNYRGRQKITFAAPSNAKYFRFTHIKEITNAMCNAGDTVLPYEPFGWAEKITCAGQTTPVYLGEVPTVRKVKKLVLTGEESGYGKGNQNPTDASYYFRASTFGIPNAIQTPYTICTHAQWGSYTDGTIYISQTGATFYLNLGINAMNAQPSGNTVAGLKEYLAAQYAAGTPVTVWYVLATPTTGIVNEPLCEIGDYADELHSEDAGVTIPTVKGDNVLTVDTTIQPSEMSITYKG